MVPFYRFEFPVDYFDNESFGGLVRLRAEVVFFCLLFQGGIELKAGGKRVQILIIRGITSW